MCVRTCVCVCHTPTHVLNCELVLMRWNTASSKQGRKLHVLTWQLFCHGFFVPDVSHGLHFVYPSHCETCESFPGSLFYQIPGPAVDCWPRFYKVCTGRDLKSLGWFRGDPKSFVLFLDFMAQSSRWLGNSKQFIVAPH